jgi:hypothetical protein
VAWHQLSNEVVARGAAPTHDVLCGHQNTTVAGLSTARTAGKTIELVLRRHGRVR